jgi:hypothetical protein
MCGQDIKYGIPTDFWCKNLLENNNLKDQRRDGRVIFIRVLKKWVVEVEYDENG